MNPIDLLRRCQGQTTQADYSKLLGISQPYLSMIMNEQRPAPAELMLNLAREFPEVRDEVLAHYGITTSADGNGNGHPCPEAQ